MRLRKSKRKAPITDAERAWLVGDQKNCGFTGFDKPRDPDYQSRLWADHGDPARFDWQPGWPRPQRRVSKNTFIRPALAVCPAKRDDAAPFRPASLVHTGATKHQTHPCAPFSV